MLEKKCVELWFDGFLHLLEHLFNIVYDRPEPGQHPHRGKKRKCTERRSGDFRKFISTIERGELNKKNVPSAIYLSDVMFNLTYLAWH